MDLYCKKLGVKVNVTILDKELFQELLENDLVLSDKEYLIRDYAMGQDEFSYLTDDINKSDDYSYQWESVENEMVLTILKEQKRIMTYSLIPTFIDS